jgi:hypothetical protein
MRWVFAAVMGFWHSFIINYTSIAEKLIASNRLKILKEIAGIPPGKERNEP